LNNGLKDLVEDYRRNSGAIILNWETLTSFSETDLKSRLVAMQNKLVNMLELLRVLTRGQIADG
jgi:hypothetical protein